MRFIFIEIFKLLIHFLFFCLCAGVGRAAGVSGGGSWRGAAEALHKGCFRLFASQLSSALRAARFSARLSKQRWNGSSRPAPPRRSPP